MGSLLTYHASLSKYVSGVELDDVKHVTGGVFCPVQTLYDTPRFHSKNGLFIARKGEVMYAACPSCVFKQTSTKKNGRFMDMMVPGAEGARQPWVAYTEENYPRVMEAALLVVNPGNKKSKQDSKKNT
jgi:hypothetical protein